MIPRVVLVIRTPSTRGARLRRVAGDGKRGGAGGALSLRLALDLVSQERELSKLQQEISQQVETKLSSQQRTFLLNEQLKTIKKELGVETDDKDALVKKFRNRIASIEGIEDVEEESAEEKWKDGVIPAVARAAIEEELSKLEALEKNSAEFNVTRNYLDWLTGLPWGPCPVKCSTSRRPRRLWMTCTTAWTTCARGDPVGLTRLSFVMMA